MSAGAGLLTSNSTVNSLFKKSRIPSDSLAKNNGRRFGSWDLQASRARGGFTLVEMSVTIAMILVLVGGASLGIQPYLAYRDGRASGEMLRSVKAAQLMYLSDYPSTPVTSLTQALILPYMPNGTWPILPVGKRCSTDDRLHSVSADRRS